MLSDLQSDSLMIIMALVAMAAFLFGLVLDGLMREDGFGAFGNMVVLTAGFFLGILAFNRYGIRFEDPTYATQIGLAGAFATIFALALIKSGLQRFLSR